MFKFSFLNFRQEFSSEQTVHLKLLSCKCQLPVVNLTTSDPAVLARFPDLFGTFHFEGIHQGKPYYTNPSLHQGFGPQEDIFKPEQTGQQRIKRGSGKIPCNSNEDRRVEGNLQKELQNQISEEIQEVIWNKNYDFFVHYKGSKLPPKINLFVCKYASRIKKINANCIKLFY